MKLHHALWRLITFSPWLFVGNLLLQIVRNLFLLLPGLLISAIFNLLSGRQSVGWNLWTLGALLVGVSIARVAVKLNSTAVDATFTGYGGTLLRRNLFAQLLTKVGAQPLPASAGDLLSRFDADTATMTSTLRYLNIVFGSALQALVALSILLLINPLLTGVILLPLVGSTLLMNKMSARIQQYHRESRKAAGEVSSFMGEIFTCVQAIQLAHAQQRVVAHLRHLNEARRRTKLKSLFFTDVLLSSLANNSANIGIGVILLLAVQGMQNGSFSVGHLALFVSYLDEFGIFIGLLSQCIALYRQAGVALQRLQASLPASVSPWALVEHAPVYLRGSYPELPQPCRQAAPLDMLEVRDLSYRYGQSDRGIEGITLRLRRGTCTVITGRVGAGKTTLLRTLLGLLPRQSGGIFWNGQLIEHPENFFVPPQCAYTPQVPHLCSETLRQNLLLGYPADDVRLSSAMHAAVMEQDLQALEQGLETLVGPRGTRLSGGQVQRAAAARMFLREPDLLVFDDLSSALDVETEQRLWLRLFTRPEHTCLLVSHRRFAFQQADHIIILEDGRIAAQGTLQELLEVSPVMQRLWLGEMR